MAQKSNVLLSFIFYLLNEIFPLFYLLITYTCFCFSYSYSCSLSSSITYIPTFLSLHFYQIFANHTSRFLFCQLGVQPCYWRTNDNITIVWKNRWVHLFKLTRPTSFNKKRVITKKILSLKYLKTLRLMLYKITQLTSGHRLKPLLRVHINLSQMKKVEDWA